MSRILLVDGNASWVRSLFSAMGDGAEVYALRTRSGLGLGSIKPWRFGADGIRDKPVCVPGWTKFPGLSTKIVNRAIKNAIGKFGIDTLVYAMPFYAGAAERFAGKLIQVYYAHDPFRFYDWDAATTAALERRMLQACDVTFAISQALAEDLRKSSDRPVIYSPNAVSSKFLEELALGGGVAEELRSLPRPIIGCVGQINRVYDWPLIGALADELANSTFVFVGPIFGEPEELQRPMRAAMAKPNVKWLGPKPHARLPEFLRGFDVCLNPLAITEHSDRRSPLRLYDYLATDRPIVSTAIREASAHEGLVWTVTTPAEGAAVLRRILGGELAVDMTARSRYIRLNTWESRAMELVRQLDSLSKARSVR